MKKVPFHTIALIALIFISSAAVLLLVIQNYHISELVEHESNPAIGDKAYIFSAIDLTGQKVNIKSANVLLIFFNTTCESCLMSVQSWQKFHDDYGSKGIKVIGISADPVERIKQLVEKYGLTFTILADPKHKIIWQYRVKYVPLVVLINRKGGILLYQRPDQSTENALSEAEKILSELQRTKPII
jgi:peroxiredoxin